MSVAISEAVSSRAVHPVNDIQIPMGTAAGINHSDSRTADRATTVSRQLAAIVSLYPVDAGRQCLGDGEHGSIFGHESHSRIIPYLVKARLRDNCGVTSKRTPERAPDGEAVHASMFIGNRWNILNVLLQDHDVRRSRAALRRDRARPLADHEHRTNCCTYRHSAA
jgi:hypothetical protein